MNLTELFTWIIWKYFLLLELVCFFIFIGGCYSFIMRKNRDICFTFSGALIFISLCQITSCSSLNLSVHWILINMWNISLSTDWYCHLNIYSCILKMNHVFLLLEFCLFRFNLVAAPSLSLWVLYFLNT